MHNDTRTHGCCEDSGEWEVTRWGKTTPYRRKLWPLIAKILMWALAWWAVAVAAYLALTNVKG